MYATSGGTITESHGFRVHTFTESGTLSVSIPGVAEVLVVAGGGGGGSGGGGGGGVLYDEYLPVAAGPQSVTIGAGGLGRAASAPGGGDNWRTYAGYDGGDSIFLTMSAVGGGGGGAYGDEGAANRFGRNGGSGGGGGGLFTGQTSAAGGAGESGPPVQGYSGGTSSASVNMGAGGGGGAGGVGGDGTGVTGGAGGVGVSVLGSFWGGGGGGGEVVVSGAVAAAGGSGGGGAGGINLTPPLAGSINTGGGGGGGAYDAGSAAATVSAGGGSGIVIIRYNQPVTEGVETSDDWSIRTSPFEINSSESATATDSWSIRTSPLEIPVTELADASDAWTANVEWDGAVSESSETSDAWAAIVEWDGAATESADASDVWEVFNWSAFQRDQLPYCHTQYICTFGGVQIPISSFQLRASWGAYPYVSVVVPGVAYESALQAEIGDVLLLTIVYTLRSVVLHSEQIVRAQISKMEVHKGASSSSIAVEARGYQTWIGSNTITLDAELFSYAKRTREYLNNFEWYQFRVHKIDPYVRLNSIITYKALSYVVYQVTFTCASRQTPEMEITAYRLLS